MRFNLFAFWESWKILERTLIILKKKKENHYIWVFVCMYGWNAVFTAPITTSTSFFWWNSQQYEISVQATATIHPYIHPISCFTIASRYTCETQIQDGTVDHRIIPTSSFPVITTDIGVNAIYRGLLEWCSLYCSVFHFLLVLIPQICSGKIRQMLVFYTLSEMIQNTLFG